MNILNVFLNILYPPRCMVCHKLLGVFSPRLLCEVCQGELSYIESHECQKCGKQLSSNYQPSYCPECATTKRIFDKGMVCFVYRNDIKIAVQRFKFKHKKYYAKEFGFLMAQKVRSVTEGSYDAIVPIPLSSKREIHRGYNQSYLLAMEVSKLLKVPMVECLEKKKEIPPQSSLSKSQRRQNVQGVYGWQSNQNVELNKVLLVDDVFTTGATLEACSEVLKTHGVKVIEVITVASGMNTY